MSKVRILFNSQEIWKQPFLPSVPQARMLLEKHAPGADVDILSLTLSAGMDALTQQGYFKVELPTDRLVQEVFRR